jgi:hypothetical protein
VFYYFAWTSSKALAWASSMTLFAIGIAYFILGCCFKDKAEDLNQPLTG